MNIWGMFFTFSVPAYVLGLMTMIAIYHELKERQYKYGKNRVKG